MIEQSKYKILLADLSTRCGLYLQYGGVFFLALLQRKYVQHVQGQVTE